MPNSQITSLNSSQVERVKALLHSRGKKVRRETSEFVADSFQAIVVAINSTKSGFPKIDSLFLTEKGKERLDQSKVSLPPDLQVFEVTDSVMNEMSEVENSQGVLAICKSTSHSFDSLLAKQGNIAYFWQLQDPGNAGTILRSADAFGFSGVALSPESVEIFSPKVVRSTVGSLWNVPFAIDVELDSAISKCKQAGYGIYAFDANAEIEISSVNKGSKSLLIFGNEARGLPTLSEAATLIKIPMSGETESLNVASAATIAMYEFGLGRTKPIIPTS
jgi:TrmH family RNA methyltransferase